MAGITFDPAKKLPIYFRVARDGSKTLTFVNTAASNYDISGFTFSLTIYDRVGGNAVLTLTEGSGLSKPDNYSLTITVTNTQTALRPNKYFYVLNRTDGSSLVKTWLNGDCFIHEGEFDGLSETTSLTIDESGTAVTVTVNDSSNTVASVALTDGATIDLTSTKLSLATSRSAITFTRSFLGDDIILEITLTGTALTLTFPSGYLCVSEGTASGDNTCSLSGTSGDKYVLAIIKIGSNNYVSCKNMGQ